LGNNRKLGPVAIKSIKIVKQDFAFIVLRKKVKWNKMAYPIEIASVWSRKPAFVTVRETGRYFRKLQTTVPLRSKVCKNVFDQFNIWKEFCTLPTGLPSTTRKNGSPLVQFKRRRPYLVGLLTDIAKTSLPVARFGKYVKTDQLLKGKWILYE
jgi:hypothetical protein